MTDEAISPLRRRMIEDMAIRKFAAKTQQADPGAGVPHRFLRLQARQICD